MKLTDEPVPYPASRDLQEIVRYLQKAQDLLYSVVEDHSCFYGIAEHVDNALYLAEPLNKGDIQLAMARYQGKRDR